MKNTINFLQIFLLICGVFGVDADEVKTVMEGESVTLNTDLTETQGFNQILWRFEDKGPVIAQIVGIDISYPDLTEIFGGRLQIDHQTGSLTIKNMRIKHSGLYKLKISQNTGSSYMTFRVTVYESPAVIDAYKAQMKTVPGTEGDSVTLQTDVTEPHGDELIVWRFGDEGNLIAKHDIEAKSSPLYDTDVRFRDRLKLDHQTGSLNITDTRNTDSGLYTVKISSSKRTLYKKFNVIISAPGLSSGAVAGIVIVLLLVCVAASAGVIYYRRKISELERKYKFETKTVLDGEDVTLSSDICIVKGEVKWFFNDEILAIGRNGDINNTSYCDDEIFKDRLELDHETGSLTIKNIRPSDSGVYCLMFLTLGIERKFDVTVNVRNISVKEGESVTLDPETEILEDDQIQWWFENILIADIRGGTGEKLDDDWRFRDRLKLDVKTGSLIITDMRSNHSGEYKLKIRSSRGTTNKTFVVTVQLRNITVKKGESVTLNPETEILRDDQIQWRFGDQDILIAEIRGGTGEKLDDDWRFRDRLKLDEKTGSLIITDMRNEQSGEYKLKIRSIRGTTNKTFVVTVQWKTLSKNEGDSVTLGDSVTILHRDEFLEWRFGNRGFLIAKISGGISGGITSIYDEVPDGRFRGRLKLDKGSLIITDTRTTDSGLYKQHVKSDCGIVSNTAVLCLDIKPPPPPKQPESEYENDAPIIRNQTDSSGKRVNESATVDMPLLNRGSGWRE